MSHTTQHTTMKSGTENLSGEFNFRSHRSFITNPYVTWCSPTRSLSLLYLLLFISLSLLTEHRASTVPRHPRLLFQFLGSIRHLVGLLGRGISPAQGLYLRRTTQHRETQTHIHAPIRIRKCDPIVRAVEDSTCLRSLGY
jgi:hypothetical protein